MKQKPGLKYDRQRFDDSHSETDDSLGQNGARLDFQWLVRVFRIEAGEIPVVNHERHSSPNSRAGENICEMMPIILSAAECNICC